MEEIRREKWKNKEERKNEEKQIKKNIYIGTSENHGGLECQIFKKNSDF